MQFDKPDPIYTYFWVVVLRDGVTTIPQYDLQTGRNNSYQDVPVDEIAQLNWYPFTEDLASKISKYSSDIILPTNNPVLTLDIPLGKRPVLKRTRDVTKYDYYQCSICNSKMFWEGNGKLECPKCYGRNEWYCRICKKIIEDPLLLPNGEARCPICEKSGEPNGLVRSKVLILRSGINHEVYYQLGIEGKKPFVYNDKGEEVELDEVS